MVSKLGIWKVIDLCGRILHNGARGKQIKIYKGNLKCGALDYNVNNVQFIKIRGDREECRFIIDNDCSRPGTSRRRAR